MVEIEPAIETGPSATFSRASLASVTARVFNDRNRSPIPAGSSTCLAVANVLVVMSCYGGGYGTISALVASYYGARGVGAVYASVFSAAALASFGAPVIVARSVDLVGSYYPALYATAGLMVVGAIIAPLVGPPDV